MFVKLVGLIIVILKRFSVGLITVTELKTTGGKNDYDSVQILALIITSVAFELEYNDLNPRH